MSFLADYTAQNVALGAVFLGLISGVLGSFAVLRQQSLVGDALSHAALPGVCLGFIIAGGRHLPSILAGAFVTAIAAALAMLALTRFSRVKTDAALGSVLSVFFAVGVVLLTYVQSIPNASQGGLDSFLFGQAAAILRSDLYVMGGITAAALVLVALFWKELKLVTFDPVFAHTIGLPVGIIETLLTLAVAMAVVVGLQMVGVVLMAAMVIAPAAAARQWVRSLGGMVVLSACFGVGAGLAGAMFSAGAANVATGPVIVIAASLIVGVSLLFAPERGLVWEAAKRRRDRLDLTTRRLLATLRGLADKHGDAAYPAEQGMLDAYHGGGTLRALRLLEERGLVARMLHMPDEGPHWRLTEAGFAKAGEEAVP
jgi:manganese/zinc/iron transport system permease protein